MSLIMTLLFAGSLLYGSLWSDDSYFNIPLLLFTSLLFLLNILLAIQVLRSRTVFVKAVGIINLILLFSFLIIIVREVITSGYDEGRNALANLLTVLYFAGNACLYPLMKKRQEQALQQKVPDVFK